MSSARAAPACLPTWRGHVETTRDALLVFEAALQGRLQHCIRRPHDRERNNLIVSGNVFVYEEGTSGIKRWTDGIPWSPSRILTNYLLYRQLNSPFPPGEKKRATKRSHRPIRAGEPYAAPVPNGNGHEDGYPMTSTSPTAVKYEEPVDKDADRILVGSLVDSYEFKAGGLLKKTMTVSVNGVQHHLVSYYSVDDARFNLQTPREDPLFKDIKCRPELLHQSKFKVQNLDDAGDGSFEQLESQQSPYPYLATNNQNMRSFGAPTHGQFSPQSPSAYYPSYIPYANNIAIPTSMANATYASMPPTTAAYAPVYSNSTSFVPFLQQTPNQIQHYPQHTHHQIQQYPQQVPHQTQHYPQEPQQQSQHRNQSQLQRRSSSQAVVKVEGQSQYQPQIQQHPQYQSNSQLQQLPQQETKHSFQTGFQQQSPTDTISRRAEAFHLYSSGHDALDIGNGLGNGLSNGVSNSISNTYYPQTVSDGTPVEEASLLLPQPAPPVSINFSSQYRSNSDGNYYPSRTTSFQNGNVSSLQHGSGPTLQNGHGQSFQNGNGQSVQNGNGSSFQDENISSITNGNGSSYHNGNNSSF